MDLSSRRHLQVKIFWRLLFLFIKSLLLYLATRKMPNLLYTYNMYIERASFCGLIMRRTALERYPMRWGSKGRRDWRMWWQRCRHPPESGDPWTEHLCVDPSCNSRCSSYGGQYNIDLLHRAGWQLTWADLLHISDTATLELEMDTATLELKTEMDVSQEISNQERHSAD
jgi:hypothetical protein